MSVYYVYIKENLKKVKDPKEVVMIKPAYDKGYYMAAIKKDGTEVQLTQKESGFSFSSIGASCLARDGMGLLYMEEFALVNMGIIALNKEVSKVYSIPREDDEKKSDIMVEVEGGRPLRLYSVKKMKAEKEVQKIKNALEEARGNASDNDDENDLD